MRELINLIESIITDGTEPELKLQDVKEDEEIVDKLTDAEKKVVAYVDKEFAEALKNIFSDPKTTMIRTLRAQSLSDIVWLNIRQRLNLWIEPLGLRKGDFIVTKASKEMRDVRGEGNNRIWN